MNATQTLENLARTRDPEAWEQLVTLAGGEIFELTRHILRDANLADDATQETLLRVRDSAGQFRPGPEHSARNWILRIACTTALKIMRSRHRNKTREEKYATDTAAERKAGSDPADNSGIDPEMRARVRSEVEALPDAQRLPIVCHYYAGMEYAKIAEELGCPVGTAKTNVHRGVEKLRERLAVLGVFAATGGIEQIEPALRGLGDAKISAVQIVKWKALLTAPKLAAASSVAATGGISVMAKVCIGSAALVLATAVVVAPRVFPASSSSTAPVSAPLVAAAPAVQASAAAPAMPQWEKDLRAQLQKQVTFDFVDTSLEEAVAFEKTVSKANILVSPAAVKAGVLTKTLNLRVTGMSISRTLELIGYLTGLSVKYRDNAVVFDVVDPAEIKRAYVPAPVDDEVRRKLQKHVTFEFVGQSLDDSVNFLNSLTKVNMVLDPRLMALKDKPQATLRVTDVSMEVSLFCICAQTRTKLRIEGGVVFIEMIDADPIAAKFSEKLQTKFADPIVGSPVEKAVDTICTRAEVKYEIDPALAVTLKKATIAEGSIPTEAVNAGVILECLAAENGFEVKSDDKILKLVPRLPGDCALDLQAKLKKKLTFDFVDTSVDEALAFFTTVSGVTMINMMTNIEDAPKITMNVREVEIGVALRRVTALCGATYVVKNGVIFIGLPAELWKLEELPAAPADGGQPAKGTEKAPAKPDEF